MRKRILLYYVVLVFIGITVTGIFTSNFTQRFYKDELEERLKNVAKIIHYQITQDLSKGVKVDYNSLAKTYSSLLNEDFKNSKEKRFTMRITFIGFDGTVLGESETNYLKMENHSNRKEVKEAIKKGKGKDIRFSKTMGVNYLYVAISDKPYRVVIRLSLPLIQLKNIEGIIWYYTVVGIIAGLIIASLLAVGFSSYITHPVKQLILMSKDIAQGNYSRRVKVKSVSELSELADNFNNMASKLEKTIADLTDKNIKLNSVMNSMKEGIIAVDGENKIILINSVACELFGVFKSAEAVEKNILTIVRNISINDMLKKAVNENIARTDEIFIGDKNSQILRVYVNPIKYEKQKGAIITIQDITDIKKLEQIRTDFVSNITHELKTPLTSIRGFIETLRSGAINDKKIAEKFLEIIDIEADRLYMLINDILQLSEIEAMDTDSSIEIYGLSKLLADILPILHKTAEHKNVKIINEVKEDIKIMANPYRIKQLLVNLIDNAIKYNVDNGSVFISAAKYEGKIVIKIKDTGIGISKEHISRIFERFYRVDKGRSRSMGGTGLGLSIVKHIVNLYSGDIKVNSKIGAGTEFIVQLPMEATAE